MANDNRFRNSSARCRGMAPPAPSENLQRGNLRERALNAARAMLQHPDSASLSMRRLASQLGVTPTSLYRHFASKAALLEAVCVEGDHELADRLKLTRVSAHIDRNALLSAALVYVLFAVDRPGLFRLMQNRSNAQQLPESPMRWLRLIGIETRINAPCGSQVHPWPLQQWLIVHGFTMLLIDRHIVSASETETALLLEQILFPSNQMCEC